MPFTNLGVKVTSLTQSAGTISSNVNGVALTVPVGSLTANNTYMIYFVIGTGLVVSTNVNSVGPAGATQWTLIGAFQATNAAAFGSFVNITGAPKTDTLVFSPSVGAGFGTPTNNNLSYWRDGDRLRGLGFFTVGTVAAAVGSIGIPTNLVLDTTKLTQSANTTAAAGQKVGGYFENAASNGMGCIVTAPGTSTTLIYAGSNFGAPSTVLIPSSSVSGNVASSGIAFSYDFDIPIVGWSRTPLVDL